MNVIVIEDEAPAARRLKRMLEKINVGVHTMLHSVEEAVQWFKTNEHPDLIFLDIQLSDGLSFEIFENVEIKSAIIFTTAYDEYALRAFKLNSIDYLLKPIDEDELDKAVQKYNIFKPVNTAVRIDFNEIRKLLVHPMDRSYLKRFTIRVGQQLKLIPVNEVECIYSHEKGTYVYTTNKRNYLLDKTLEYLESEIPPEAFFRVSRKFYVNIDAIKNIIDYTNSRLKIELHNFNEHEIIVSRERVKDFKDWLV